MIIKKTLENFCELILAICEKMNKMKKTSIEVQMNIVAAAESDY